MMRLCAIAEMIKAVFTLQCIKINTPRELFHWSAPFESASISKLQLVAVRSGLISKPELIFACSRRRLSFSRRGKAVYISWRSSRAPGASSQFTSQRLWPVGSESCRFAPRFWRTRRRWIFFYTLGHSEKSIIISSLILGSNRCEGQTVNTHRCALPKVKIDFACLDLNLWCECLWRHIPCSAN